MNTFSVGHAFSAGWSIFTKRAWFFIASFLFVTIVEAVLGQACQELARLGAAAGIIGSIGSILVGVFYGMGIVNVTLKALDDPERVTLRDFWHPQQFWNFLGASLLMAGAVIVAGIIAALLGGIASLIVYFTAPAASMGAFLTVFIALFVIASVYIAILFMFSRYLVIARAFGPVDSLKESMRITKGHRLALLGFFLLSIVCVILGAICLIVGLFVAIPVVSLATAHAYRTLEQLASEPVPAAL